MRAAISTLPDGIFRAEDIVDGDGLDDEPLRVRVAVERRGDSLHVDFTGTAAQTRGPINCPIASTESAVYYAVTAILDPGIAPNHGSYLPIEVERSVRKRPQPEAPCACGRSQRAHPSHRDGRHGRARRGRPRRARSRRTTATRTSTCSPRSTTAGARTFSSRSRSAAGVAGRASTVRTASPPASTTSRTTRSSSSRTSFRCG